MIEFIKRDDGAIIVNRKGDDFLGVIEKNSENKMIFTSIGSATIDGSEALIIAASLLSDTDYGEYVQRLINEGFLIEIKVAEEE